MGFMEILLEAKRKEKPKKVEKTDALDVNVDDTEDTEVEDANDATMDDGDEATDYSEEEYDVEADDEDTDDDTDLDNTEDETTDYGDETDDDSTDENGEDTESDTEQENNEEETGKDLKLLTDFSNLYQMIVETLNKLNNSMTINLITKQVMTQVSKNLLNTKEMLYDYIVLDYKKATHAQRLKQYAYFLEAVKINVAMLKKVGTSFSIGKQNNKEK